VTTLLDTLEETALSDKTIILRLADHGEGGLSLGMREKAYTVYEEMIHILLIVHNPKLYPEPLETEAFCDHPDPMPTEVDPGFGTRGVVGAGAVYAAASVLTHSLYTQARRDLRSWLMAQSVCVIVSAADRERLQAIAGERNRPRKHVERARPGLASVDREPAAGCPAHRRQPADGVAPATALCRSRSRSRSRSRGRGSATRQHPQARQAGDRAR
jgi:hypothetical protein